MLVIMLHQSFDWSCRSNKRLLVKNLESVVKRITGLTEVDITPSSPLFKAANKCYDLVKKKKNERLGKELFLKNEQKTLKSYEVKLEEKQAEEAEDNLSEEELNDESVKEKVSKGKKRKNFSDLKSKKQKKARLNDIMEIIKEDVGIEDEVLEELKTAKGDLIDKRQKEEKEEEFKMACLNAMKTLALSDTKYDDLRFWLFDMIQRGFNLLEMPASKTLKAKVRKEMIPRDMRSSETGAEFDISDALFHTGQRFLERPDVRQHLKNGDIFMNSGIQKQKLMLAY